MPYLLDRRISSIDYAIISHYDTDHIGGILYLMENYKIKNIVISKQPEESDNLKKFVKILNEKHQNLLYVKKGDRLQIEQDIYFNILFPDTNNFVKENALNNNSIACKLCYKNFSMLFTGDIEKEGENVLLKEYEKTGELQSTILKAPHHGSKTSSTKDFLNKINPKITLIGVGKNNLYGHPNEEVLKRLQDAGSQIFRTDKDGEITVTVDWQGRVGVSRFIN